MEKTMTEKKPTHVIIDGEKIALPPCQGDHVRWTLESGKIVEICRQPEGLTCLYQLSITWPSEDQAITHSNDGVHWEGLGAQGGWQVVDDVIYIDL
jgi:hypothetical protein